MLRVAFSPSASSREVTVQQRVLKLVLLLLVVVSAAAQTTAQRQPPMRQVDGATIFRNNCAACHGLEGRGNGPASKALKRNVPDLTRLSQRNGGTFPAIHVRTTIMLGADDLLPAHGSKTMPIWGPIFHEIEFGQDFGNVRLENVTEYLESLQRK
jgi:mono/diheme cytochrome c family protein